MRPETNLGELQKLVDETAAYRMGIMLLSRHKIVELGRKVLINVWVSNQGLDWTNALRLSNLDLVILMAYQLARLPAQTKVIVLQCEFIDSLTQVPRADLSILGLPKPSDITFCQRIVKIVDSSCVFVRDSGDESALA